MLLITTHTTQGKAVVVVGGTVFLAQQCPYSAEEYCLGEVKVCGRRGAAGEGK